MHNAELKKWDVLYISACLHVCVTETDHASVSMVYPCVILLVKEDIEIYTGVKASTFMKQTLHISCLD